MAVKKIAATPPRPNVEEWDFSSCPEDEIEYCCYYEYARENGDIKKKVAALRATGAGEPRLFPGDAAYYQNHWFNTFFSLFVEFPDTPWLKVGAAVRYKRCKECYKFDAPFMDVFPERLANDQEAYPYFPEDVGSMSLHSVHAVEIDWTASNDAIKRAFDQWLEASRPSAEAHWDQTGRVTDRELLKYLGAFRLLRNAGNDWTLASSWSQKYGNGTAWTPAYSDERAYKRAKQHAKKIIADGIPLTPSASLINKLDFSKLSPAKRARVKVQIMQMKRAEIRKLGKQKGEAALAEILGKLEGGA
jgi:hypothetical protein